MVRGGGRVIETGFDVVQRGGEAGEVGFLRQIANGRTGLGEPAAGVGLDEAGGDAQQGGLAGAVAADQADPVTGGDGQAGAGQQRLGAKGQGDILERENGRGHGAALHHPALGWERALGEL